MFSTQLQKKKWMPEGYQLGTAVVATHFGNLDKSFGGSEIKKRSWRKEKDENFRINC